MVGQIQNGEGIILILYDLLTTVLVVSIAVFAVTIPTSCHC